MSALESFVAAQHDEYAAAAGTPDPLAAVTALWERWGDDEDVPVGLWEELGAALGVEA